MNISADNDIILPEIGKNYKSPHIYEESTVKDRRTKLNQSASPTGLSTNDVTIINDIKNSLKQKKKRYLKKDLNSQLKLSRNNISNRRKTDGHASPNLRNGARGRNAIK
jgi:hypothetical protein